MINDQRGAAALIAVIIFTALVALAAVSISVISLGNIESGFSTQTGTDAVLAAESCIEEAMYQLQSDNSYAGSTVDVGDTECTIVVTGTPCGTCTITVDAVADTFTRTIEAVVDVSGSTLDIQSWEETQ